MTHDAQNLCGCDAKLLPHKRDPYCDDEHDQRDEHDTWHPRFIEGCDACHDRAQAIEDGERLPDRLELEALEP